MLLFVGGRCCGCCLLTVTLFVVGCVVVGVCGCVMLFVVVVCWCLSLLVVLLDAVAVVDVVVCCN